MSGPGQTRRFGDVRVRSALHLIADVRREVRQVSECQQRKRRMARNQFQPLNELWRTCRDTIVFSPAYFSAFEDADRTAS